MRTIRNTTHRPLRVPLPRGKVLHLGPRQEGQVATHHVDHPPLQKLVAAGEVEIGGEGRAAEHGHDGGHVHDDTHGHHPDVSVPKRGDR